MSEYDLYFYHQQCYQIVAKRLGIRDYEWKSNTELHEEIKNKDADIIEALVVLFKAYKNWFKSHEEIKSKGTSGNLTKEQKNKLTNAINKRDTTRQSLIDQLNDKYSI